MLERLSSGPMSVSLLAEPFDISLAAVVQHLQVLQKAGLLMTEKVGRVRSCRVEAQACAQPKNGCARGVPSGIASSIDSGSFSTCRTSGGRVKDRNGGEDEAGSNRRSFDSVRGVADFGQDDSAKKWGREIPGPQMRGTWGTHSLLVSRGREKQP